VTTEDSPGAVFFLSQGALEPQASPDFQAAHLGAPDFRQQLVTKNAVVPVFFQGNRGTTNTFYLVLLLFFWELQQKQLDLML